MLVPLSWLADYVDIDRDADSLAAALTSAGLKVEAIHRPGADIEGVVVGEVKAVMPHVDADKLLVVDVSTGVSVRPIVCGAHNFKVGDKVPVALPGARLPGDVTIGRATIRGEVSEGMLCSARELGVADDHSGILVLPPDAELGAEVTKVLGLDDVILDIEVTTNRPDAMSLLGIAREVAAITGGHVTFPALRMNRPTPGSPPVEELAQVTVEDPAGSPRYLARVITGVTPGPSPEWVAKRLTAAGVRPISNIVDATNYALLVTGHPMHAFDLDKLSGSKIVVRRASSTGQGERIVTIDGATRELVADDLVIADAEAPVALAGIMGGRDTEVSDSTTRILLESAYFDPASVLRSSKRHGVRSEASARFERGADPNNVPYAAELASALIQEWAGGESAPGVIDVYPEPVEPWSLTLRPERANEVLGTGLGVEEMVDDLRRLGLNPVVEDGLIRVAVPTRRPDLRAEWDLIEEIARLTGYDRIPSRIPSGARVGGLNRPQRLHRRVRNLLTGAGLFEAVTTAMIGPADLDRMGYPPENRARAALRVTNPLTVDESILRPSLLPGLVASAARNVARRNLCVRLFEVGRCFLPRETNLLPSEPLRLGIVLHGPTPQEWHTPSRELDFFDLKGIVEMLMEALRIDHTFGPTTRDLFTPGRTAALVAPGGAFGTIGELAAATAERYGFTNRVVAAELELGRLLELARDPGAALEPPKFPPVLLDLAVAVPEAVEAAEIIELARSAGGSALVEVRIFDVYRGEQAGAGRKSLALSLTFLRPDRTLTQDEAVAARDAIAAALRARLGAEVRE
ncbi:MAG TPA: phenylalanine--tRNA ligase subunit beta [Actinomycetota bacterium]|nr:phenylalanine--tRNA ligase subunit beta [Actinomycetota bacterium]